MGRIDFGKHGYCRTDPCGSRTVSGNRLFPEDAFKRFCQAGGGLAQLFVCQRGRFFHEFVAQCISGPYPVDRDPDVAGRIFEPLSL